MPRTWQEKKKKIRPWGNLRLRALHYHWQKQLSIINWWLFTYSPTLVKRTEAQVWFQRTMGGTILEASCRYRNGFLLLLLAYSLGCHEVAWPKVTRNEYQFTKRVWSWWSVTAKENQKDDEVRTFCIYLTREKFNHIICCEVQRCQVLLRKGLETGKKCREMAD